MYKIKREIKKRQVYYIMYNCLVIGAGGHNIIRMIGCIEKLVTVNHLILKDIKDIYATSAGSILSAYLCLDLDWDILTDYIINKPWGKKFENTPTSLLTAFNDLGLFGDEYVRDILEIQFKMKGLNINTITFKELYEYSNKRINVYSFNVNKFECECFNYKNTPDMRVLDGIYMSSTFPFVFKPKWINDSYYLDGGINLDFPYVKAIEDGMNDKNILSIKMVYPGRKSERVNRETNILKLIMYLLQKLIRESRMRFEINNDPVNLINIEGEKFSLESMSKITNKENISEMIYQGRNASDKYLNEKIYKTELTNSVKVSTLGSASNSLTEPPLTK